MADRSVSVVMKAQVEGFVSGIKKAETATDALKAKVEQTAKSHMNIVRAAELVGTVGAIAIGKKLVGAASDLNETLSKTSVVFGQNADAVVAWSKTSATAMGMSQQQAAEAAATLGNLFVSMNLSGKASADMSTRMVQLASDLASFNNTNPADALEALRAGLVGEVEPLRRYGVNLNDAQLRQEAVALGLEKTTKNVLPPAVRAQAAYALILQQTKTAQGDFARTSSGLANSQRIFTAEVANAQAALGNALLPTVNAGVHALNSLLGVFNGLPQPIQSAVVVTGALGGALVLLAPRIMATKALMADLGVSGKSVGIGLGKATLAVAALAAASVAVNHFAEASVNAGKGANELANSLTKLGKTGLSDASLGFQVAEGDVRSFNDALWLVADSHAWDQLGTAIAGVAGQDTTFSLAKKSIDQVDASLAQLVTSGHAANAAAAFQTLSLSFAATGGDVSKLKDMFPQYRDAIAGVSAATTGYAGSAGNAARKTYDLNAAIDKLRGKAMDADQATAALEQAIDDATQAVKDNGKALHEHNGQLDLSTPKARAARDALANIASTALDGVAAWRANGMGAREVGQKTLEARNAFVKTATQMGLNKTEAGKLADAYGLIPRKVVSDIVANTKPARAALSSLQQQYADLVRFINSHPIETAAHYGLPAPKKGKGHAFGGPIVGPGTSTSDSILTPTSVGEYVIRASSVAKYGPSTFDQMNAGTWSPAQPMPSSSTPSAIALSIAAAPVVLQIGWDEVWKGLLQYKADRGGGSLGL